MNIAEQKKLLGRGMAVGKEAQFLSASATCMSAVASTQSKAIFFPAFFFLFRD